MDKNQIPLVFSECIAKLRDFMESHESISRFRVDRNYFIRNKKLTFPRLIVALMSKSQHALNARVNYIREAFSKLFISCSFTPSAMSQARVKLKPEIFEELLNIAIKEFYNNRTNKDYIKKWKGYLLLAIDGTHIDIPDTYENREEIGVQELLFESLGTIQMQGSVLYDVLNEIAICSCLDKRGSELDFARNKVIGYIKKSEKQFLKDSIIIHDRGYEDYLLMANYMVNNQNFVIRSKRSKIYKIVEQFINGKETDSLLKIMCPENRKKEIRERGLPDSIIVRGVKVTLDSGEIETLLTSLIDQKEFPTECFKELYFKRWGVETCYNNLKNILEIERFSSPLFHNILQDFYSHVFMHTLCSILSKEGKKEIELENQGKHRKYLYKLCPSLVNSAFISHIIEIFYAKNSDLINLYANLKQWMHSHLIPIRPDRKYHRNKGSDSKRLVYQLYLKKHHS